MLLLKDRMERTKSKRRPSAKSAGSAAASPWMAVVSALASPRITTALLVAVLLFCVAGSWLPQEGTDSRPLEKIFQPEVLYALRSAQLTDLFRSGWFFFVLILLILNLLISMALHLPEALRLALRATPGTVPAAAKAAAAKRGDQYVSFETPSQIGREQFRDLVSAWARLKVGKAVAVRDEGGLNELQMAAQSGRLSGVALWIAHLSLLMIIGGAALEFLRGFDGLVTLVEGSKVSYVQILRGSHPKWPVLGSRGDSLHGFHDPGFEIEASRFERTPDQVRTQLSFRRKGGLPESRIVALNAPAEFGGLRFVQAGFEPTAQLKLNLSLTERTGEEAGAQLEMRGIFQDRTYELDGASFRILELQDAPDTGLSARIEYAEGQSTPQRFWVFQKHPGYDAAHRKGSRYHFTLGSSEPRFSTTLRVSRNPGLGLLAAGSVILALSLVLSTLVAHHRYWFIWKPGHVSVLAASSRPFLFSPDFERAMTGFKAMLARSEKPKAGEGARGR